MVNPKSFTFLMLLAIALIFISVYFSPKELFTSKEPSRNTTEQVQPEIASPADDKKIAKSDVSLFTDTIICKAITNAVVGMKPTMMEATRTTDKIVISFNRESDGKHVSYDCKRVDNRFYWNSSTRVLSQSIIEVDAKVTAPRLDRLELYIYESLDRGNIAKTYTIDEFN